MAVFSQAELAIVRRAYARQVAATAGTGDARIVDGLALLRREDFLPSGPWSLHRWSVPDVPTPDADPLFLYQDVAVPILAAKGLNNGVPSFVTRMIAAAAIRDGDRIVHVGTGTGYYTALMAEVAGRDGRVLGIEHEPDLARRASDLLASYAGVRIVQGDGWTLPLEPADVVLVNAGALGISATWRDALPLGGRLVVPLAARQRAGDRLTTRGVVLRLQRDTKGFAVSLVSPVAIYPCLGADDPRAEARLKSALEKGGAHKVRRLVEGAPPDEAAAWLVGDGWYLV